MESYINSLLGSDQYAAAEQEQAENEAGAAAEEVARPLLPFPFAKRCGGYVLDDGKSITLYHKDTIDPSVVAEIQRHLGGSFGCVAIKTSRFDGLLAKAYESRNNEAMQMVEDLGDEMDLASLADSVPESEDLLEQEDDLSIA